MSRLSFAFIVAVVGMTSLQHEVFGMGMGWGDDDPTPDFVSELVDRVGTFRSPSRLVLTSAGHLYVADSSAGVVAVYDVNGPRVGTLKAGDAPLGLEVLETVSYRCTSSSGRKVGCSSRRRGVQKIEVPVVYAWIGDTEEGSVRRFVDGNRKGYLGIGPGEFVKPNGMAALSSRNLYVVDSGANLVAAYDHRGTMLFRFGEAGTGDGQLQFPTDIAINETLGEVYVGDFGNRRVAVFDLSGNWLRNLAAPPNDNGDPAFIGPAGLSLDPTGNLLVTDNALSCVVVMDSTGLLLDIIGYQQGQYWTGDLEVPIDAVSDGDFIYVTSNEQGHVNVFEATTAEGDG